MEDSVNYSNQFYSLWRWNDDIEIMMGSKINDFINRLIDFLLQEYQEGIQSMNQSEFV